MTDDFTFEAPPRIPAGTYPIAIISVEPVTIDTAEGPTPLVRWSGTVETDEGMVAVDALSSRNFGPTSKARRWAAALLGREPGDTLKASELALTTALAVLAFDDKGYTKLADIVPPVGKARK